MYVSCQQALEKTPKTGKTKQDEKRQGKKTSKDNDLIFWGSKGPFWLVFFRLAGFGKIGKTKQDEKRHEKRQTKSTR